MTRHAPRGRLRSFFRLKGGASARQHDDRHRALIGNLPDVIWTTDTSGRAVYISPRIVDVFGFTQAEVYEQGEALWLGRIHPDDTGRVWTAYQRLFSHGDLFDVVYRYRHRDGHWVWIHDRALTTYEIDGVKYSDGTLNGSLSATFDALTSQIEMDAARRRAAEAALLEREASFRALFSANPLPMWVYEEATLRFVEVNDAAIKQYGYSRDEFLAMRISDIRPPEDLPAFLAYVSGPRAERPPGGLWRHTTKSGAVLDVEISSHTLTFDGLQSVLVIAQDVTERLSLESQLRQAQKMEAVGRLAGGVAHDFNNLLTAILGYTELMSDGMPADHPLRDDLAEIHKAGTSAAALTRQLLAFSRKQVLQPETLDLNAVLVRVESMLRRLIGEHIALETDFAPDLVAVTADPGQIEQIVINLAVNARDAMPGGGRLTLATRNVELDRGDEHAAGVFARLSVGDTGTGIDAESRAHIFEPFFTTKERGEGTGLGLSTVYGIVKQSGGSIAVESEPGRGATFHVCLPETGNPLRPAAARDGDGAITGNETILLAEDQDEVRGVARAILHRHGYRVLEAANGRQALERLQAADQKIDLLLTDIVMPDMTGPELVAAADVARRGVRVLYSSGYTGDAVSTSVALASGAAFLQKPYTARALLLKVRQVLDAKPDIGSSAPPRNAMEDSRHHHLDLRHAGRPRARLHPVARDVDAGDARRARAGRPQAVERPRHAEPRQRGKRRHLSRRAMGALYQGGTRLGRRAAADAHAHLARADRRHRGPPADIRPGQHDIAGLVSRRQANRLPLVARDRLREAGVAGRRTRRQQRQSGVHHAHRWRRGVAGHHTRRRGPGILDLTRRPDASAHRAGPLDGRRAPPPARSRRRGGRR